MPYLADTNILLRFISPSDPNHPLIRNRMSSSCLPPTMEAKR
jgi:hypothetical protein